MLQIFLFLLPLTDAMFQFKEFSIHQDRTAMKVGTDGVLLGAWADLEQAYRILDIGTGTGLIALMAAQRNNHAYIDAIEIEEHAFKQAQENIAASPWKDRIHIEHTPLQYYSPNTRYDCIVCNPPFFINSTKNPSDSRTLARHNDTLPHEELVDHAKRLLTSEGKLHLILPIGEAQDLIAYAQKVNFHITHLTYVHSTPCKPPKRLLIELSIKQNAYYEDNITIELGRHRYSEAYIKLTRQFYLHM